MRVVQKWIAALCGVSLLACSAVSLLTAADTPLEDGSVKGLPERLTVMDNEGQSVSDLGEYFFHVENMTYGETYTKQIQIMNLREDRSYHVYFYINPIEKSGDIDLEKGCTCIFKLDGSEIYSGTVNGIGTKNLIRNHVDLGLYQPGESHILDCAITWNDIDVIQDVNNGKRLVDKDGVAVLEGPDESGEAYGEIEFKWIFYASVDETAMGEHSFVDTGLLSIKNSFWLTCIGIAAFLVILMLILLSRKKKRSRKKGSKT